MNENFLTTEDSVRLFYQKLGDSPKTIMVPNGVFFSTISRRWRAIARLLLMTA